MVGVFYGRGGKKGRLRVSRRLLCAVFFRFSIRLVLNWLVLVEGGVGGDEMWLCAERNLEELVSSRSGVKVPHRREATGVVQMESVYVVLSGERAGMVFCTERGGID